MGISGRATLGSKLGLVGPGLGGGGGDHSRTRQQQQHCALARMIGRSSLPGTARALVGRRLSPLPASQPACPPAEPFDWCQSGDSESIATQIPIRDRSLVFAVHRQYSAGPTVSCGTQHAARLTNPCKPLLSTSTREDTSQLIPTLSADKASGCARTVDKSLGHMRCPRWSPVRPLLREVLGRGESESGSAIDVVPVLDSTAWAAQPPFVQTRPSRRDTQRFLLGHAALTWLYLLPYRCPCSAILCFPGY